MRGEAWFAARTAFNDPFDCKPRLSFEATKQQLRRYANHVYRDLRSADRKKAVSEVVRRRHEWLSRDRETVTAKLNHALDTRPGIYCLSAKNDDLLMWGHYAAAHTGVCVQFDLSVGDPFLARAHPVTYQETYPVVRPIVQKEFESYAPTFLTKSDRWSYEAEWRIVHLRNGAGLRNIRVPAVSGVILGARIEPTYEATIRGWAERRDPSLRVVKAQLGQYRYEILCAGIEPDELLDATTRWVQ